MEGLQSFVEIFGEFFDKILEMISPSTLKVRMKEKWDLCQSLAKADKSFKLLREYINSINKPEEELVTITIEKFLHHAASIPNPSLARKSLNQTYDLPSKAKLSEDIQPIPPLKHFELPQKPRKDRIHSIDNGFTNYRNVRNELNAGKPSYLKIQEILKTDSPLNGGTFHESHREVKAHNRSETISYWNSLPEFKIHSLHLNSFIEEVVIFNKEMKDNKRRIEDWLLVLSNVPLKPIIKKKSKRIVVNPSTSPERKGSDEQIFTAKDFFSQNIKVSNRPAFNLLKAKNEEQYIGHKAFQPNLTTIKFNEKSPIFKALMKGGSNKI